MLSQPNPDLGVDAARIGVYGTTGWALESAWRRQPARSVIFADTFVPFLPIYGVGGLLAAKLGEGRPFRKLPWYARALAYGAVLTAFEWASCHAGRAVYGHVNWHYDGGDGCVDLSHALAWAALGLSVERVDPLLFAANKGKDRERP